MSLRLNQTLNLLRNEAFDSTLISYEENYNASPVHSTRFKEHIDSVLSLLKSAAYENSLMVEVGCGKGEFVERVAADKYFRVRGYDASYVGHSKLIEKRYLKHTDRINADLVVLRHVLEHIPAPFDFLLMLKAVFGHAKIYIEVPNYDWITANRTFFDITYEHVNYFSERALKLLFNDSATQHEFLFEEQYQYVISDFSSLNSNFKREYESDDRHFVSFRQLFPSIEENIRRFEQKAQNRSVYLWGAGTKGCLFLARCASQRRLIQNVRFAIDQNPQKIGKYLPGSLIEIKSKAHFFSEAKEGDLLLIANPAYSDEIIAEISASGLQSIKVENM